MPKTAIDEKADASASPDNVGTSGVLQPNVESVASEARLLEKRP